jgi:diadenosine tetraphosphatase ApaH/serine/threonine PP2A family protein phosphatase
LPTSSFNTLAKEAICWTREQLAPEDLEFLGALPLVERVDGADFVHGALYTPELFDYVQSSYDAALSMSCMKNRVCFVGHSHVPITFVQRDVIRYMTENEIPVAVGERVLVNVGSVGQPRDKDPRACFAVYDTTEGVIRIQRVRYDVDAVVRKLRAAGLPVALGERLRVGR